MELIQTERDLDLFTRQLLNIGEALYGSGSEISTIEENLHILGKAYGAEHVNVYAITSSIVVTIEYPGMSAVTQSRRVRRESTDLRRLDSLYSLCHRCSEAPIPVSELRALVLKILAEKPSEKRTLCGQVIAAGCFVLFFGGSILDGLFGAFFGFVIWLLQKYLRPLCSGAVFVNFLVSFAVGALTCVFAGLIPALSAEKIMIGDIMVLIPGIAITNSIRYTISGDSISGVEKLIASVLQAVGIASGFSLAISLVL